MIGLDHLNTCAETAFVDAVGFAFDTPAESVAAAPRIRPQAVASHAMPLGNITNIAENERAQLGAWIDAGAKGP